MAADDIFSAVCHFEGPTSASSIVLHYQETTAQDSGLSSPRALGLAIDDQLTAVMKDVLSDDWFFSSVVVRLLNFTNVAMYRTDIAAGVGTRTGPSLPANMTWMIKQAQTLFGAKSNGRLFIPGLAEGDTLIGVLTNAFATTQAAALGVALCADLTQISAGTGIWNPGVISRKVLDAAPPAKDWDGAFSPVSTCNPWTIISHQRRRKTPVVGAKQ